MIYKINTLLNRAIIKRKIFGDSAYNIKYSITESVKLSENFS